MSSAIICILGAKDPEMDHIEKLLTKHSVPYVYCIDSNKQRVIPRKAYEQPLSLIMSGINSSSERIWIECAPKEGTIDLRIDHHREGDPGYNEPSFMGASIAQLCQLFGWSIDRDVEITAWMDHCPHRIREWCDQQSDPQLALAEVENIWCHQIAEGTQSTPESIRDQLVKTRAKIGSLDKTGNLLIDYNVYPETGRDRLVLLKAVFLEGLILHHYVKEQDNRVKLCISGACTSEQVEAFIACYKTLGLTVYGVPLRGYAAAYLPNLMNKCIL